MTTDTHTEIAKIETTVLCGDLLAHINRSLGQIHRRAIERIQRHQHELRMKDAARQLGAKP